MLKKLHNLNGVTRLNEETMMNLRGGKSAFFACTPFPRCRENLDGSCFCCPVGYIACDVNETQQVICLPNGTPCT